MTVGRSRGRKRWLSLLRRSIWVRHSRRYAARTSARQPGGTLIQPTIDLRLNLSVADQVPRPRHHQRRRRALSPTHPARRHAGRRQNQLAATPHNSRRHALPCWGGGDRQDHRRECHGAGTTQGGRTMNNNLKAFVLSVGGLLAVAGSGLLVLWAVLS
jgi:hypothetical protein